MGRRSSLGSQPADLYSRTVEPRRLTIASVGSQVAELVPCPEERADFFGETNGIKFLALFRVVPVDCEGVATALRFEGLGVGKGEIDDLGRRRQVFLHM